MKTKFDKNEYFKKYRKDKLTQLSAAIDSQLALDFKIQLARDGISFRKFLLHAINIYLKRGDE